MAGSVISDPVDKTSFYTDPSKSAVLKVFFLAWPALILQFLHLVINLWDRFIAGRYLLADSSSHLSIQTAQTTGQYFSWLISSYSVLVTVGSTALVARFVGAGDFKSASKVVHQSLILAFAFGVLASLLAIFFIPFILPLIGLEGMAAKEAYGFLFNIFVLLPFQMVEAAGIACLVGAGNTLTGLMVLTFVTMLNIPLSYIFATGVLGFANLGFSGIAFGTSLSHFAGSGLVLILLLRGSSSLVWHFLEKIDFELVTRLLRISLPAGVDSLSIGIGQFIFLAIINNLGEAAGGAHGIALGWEALGYLSGAAFGTAAIALVGLNLGAGLPNEASKCAWTAYFLGAVFMSIMGMIFFFFSEPMFLVFCPDPSQAEIVRIGAPVLRLIAFAMPFLASCIIMTSALRGAGDTRVPVIFTWIGFFLLRIPAALLFARNPSEDMFMPELAFGLLGAWLAMFIDLFARGVLLIYRFATGKWKLVKV
ncbi:MAG: MATE family efflux transporter [Gemmataceae bacterium]